MVAGVSRSSGFSIDDQPARFVVCVDPGEHDDLQARRIYRVLADDPAERSRFIRVIDDSGEDYLYPASCFLAVELPSSVRAALLKAS